MGNVVEAMLLNQVQQVFVELDEELSEVQSGAIFIHLRNNMVGKFGIKHDPIEGSTKELAPFMGLTEAQRQELKKVGS